MAALGESNRATAQEQDRNKPAHKTSHKVIGTVPEGVSGIIAQS
jgi:hypothetical protein